MHVSLSSSVFRSVGQSFGTRQTCTHRRQSYPANMHACACCAQASAAAFAKGLLDLEGTSLTPILVSLVRGIAHARACARVHIHVHVLVGTVQSACCRCTVVPGKCVLVCCRCTVVPGTCVFVCCRCTVVPRACVFVCCRCTVVPRACVFVCII